MDIESMSENGRAGRRGLLWLIAVALITFVMASPADVEAGGDALFKAQCAVCHSLGTDRIVGPGLGEVANRREHEWLMNKITQPDRLAEGDAVTAELIAEYGMPMPNLGVGREQAESILGYIAAASGAPLPERSAGPDVAPTPPSDAQVFLGRQLFEGTTRLANRGVSCNACHSAAHDDVFGGGSLAVDLTNSYGRLGGPGIEAMLKNPPFPVMRVAYADKPLTDEEVTALAAFLSHTNTEQAQAYSYGIMFFGTGLMGSLLLIGFFSMLWRGRRRGSVNQSIYDRQLKSS
ncbi:MAG: c-type cytochrome [Bradymonadaceae bacterium]